MFGGVKLVKKYVLSNNNKKHFTKNELSARKDAEKQAGEGLDPLQVTAPNHMNSIAKQEYKRIIKDLQKLPLRNLDRATLEMYCLWYSVMKETSRELNKQGMYIEGKPNPLISVLDKATKNIKSTVNDLGLSVDSRMRLYIPPTTNENKPKGLFDKYG